MKVQHIQTYYLVIGPLQNVNKNLIQTRVAFLLAMVSNDYPSAASWLSVVAEYKCKLASLEGLQILPPKEERKKKKRE